MNDICLIEVDMLKYCKLSAKLEQIEGGQKRSSHSNLVGLPNGPGLGFINSVFQIFMNAKDIKKQLIMLDHNRTDKLIYCIARIHNLLVKQIKIESMDIKELVELYLSKYTDFEVGMSYNVRLHLFSSLMTYFQSLQRK